MKLKAKHNNEGIIEKFTAQSSKTAKYAKSVIRKGESSEFRSSNLDTASNAGTVPTAISQVDTSTTPNTNI